MKRIAPGLPYLAFFALALFLAQALLRPDSPCTDDAFYHINRAVVLENELRQGQLFPRWQPEMAWGFGYPQFNYYAPLGSYLLVALHQLGLIYPVGLNVLFVAGLWLAGAAAYWLGREWWGAAGGFVTGVAYQSAPYLAFNILYRGALAETLGLVWLPLVLFTFHRALTVRPARAGASRLPVTRWDLAAVAALAGLLYAHNATALSAAPLIAAYAALLALKRRAPGQLVRGSLLFAAGLALSARFWLPALGERGLVQSDRLLVPPIFTYYTNYLSLRELLALPRVEDPLLINPSPEKGLGLLAAGLAGLGALAGGYAAWRRGPAAKYGPAWPSVFFLAALAGYACLTLAVSQPLWDHVPLIAFLQFPWRLLSGGALCAALLIGANTLWWPRGVGVVAVGLTLVLALGQLGWWYPRDCEAMREATLARTLQYERETNTIGSTAKGEYLPITVHRFPDDRSIADALIAGRTPAYLAGLPDASGLAVLQPYPLDYTAALTLTAPAALTFKQFYFPGWWATLDGAPLKLQPDADFGLITFAVPAGAHTLRLGFGDTPIRTAGDWLSLLTLIALAALLPLAALATRLDELEALTWPTGIALLTAAVLLNGLRPWVLDRLPNPLVHSAFNPETGAVADVAQVLGLRLTGGLNVAGYDLSARELPADGGVDAALYLSLTEPAPRALKPAFFISDAAGLLWDDTNALLPPRWQREPPPTFAWPVGNYAQWAYRLEVLPGTPPGRYALAAAVFDKTSFETLSVLDEQGNAAAPQFTLGTLDVTRPAQPFNLRPEKPTPHTFGPLTLLGYRQEQAALQAGDTLKLTWYWRAAAAPLPDQRARLDLLDARGQSVFGAEVAPVAGYATSQWRAGDEWRGQPRLVIPAALPGGDYQLVASLPGQAGQQPLYTLHIQAPQRTFTPPPLQIASGARFPGVGTLAGVRLAQTGRSLQVTLVWKAEATPPQSYTAFVHVGDAARVWAQSDAVPGGRPTTGWLAGEYVTDARTLTLPADMPPGVYGVWVGLYDPVSAARVAAEGPGAGSDNRVQAATVTVP